MAFKGTKGTANEEIDKYLKENIGDFRPDWQSLYFDLMGMGEVGALAEITRKEGLQQISKWMRRMLTRTGTALEGGMSEIRPMTAGEKASYRSLAKSVHQSPEKFLNPVSELQIHPKISVERASGELEEIYGSFNRGTDTAKFNLGSFAERAHIDPNKASTTFFHEVGHAMQKETGMNVNFISQNAREVHMQMFADDMERLASRTKGTVSDEMVEQVFEDTWSKTQQLLAGGEVDAGEIASRIQNLRVNEINMSKMNPAFQKMERSSDDIVDYFTTRQLDPLDKIVQDLGGQMFEQIPKEVTAGDIIEGAIISGRKRRLTQDALDLGRRIYKGEVSADVVKDAYSKLMKNEGMDVMERVTTGQYMTEALEMNKILRGETKGLEGKVQLLKDWGALKPEDLPY